MIFTDLILIISAAVVIIICICLTKGLKIPEKENKIKFKQLYYMRCRIWLRAATLYKILAHWANAVSMLCGILILYLSISDVSSKEVHIIVYSSVNIFFMFLNLSIAPEKMAFGYKQAYVLLDAALLNTLIYDEKDKEIIILELNKAIQEGEIYISEAVHDKSFTLNINKK